MMGRAAVSHVVLRMHLEPGDGRVATCDVAIVLGLQPDPGASRDRERSRGYRKCRDHCHCSGSRFAIAPAEGLSQPLMGSREPLRVVPSLSLTCVVAQVPFGTYFQAPFSKSPLAV